MAESSEDVTVTLELESGYRFRVDLGDPAWPPLLVDEPRPLGEASGPNASRVLAAAVGNCLSASLLFCLRKARVEVGSLRTIVRATAARKPARPASGHRAGGEHRASAPRPRDRPQPGPPLPRPLRGLLRRHRERPGRAGGRRPSEGLTPRKVALG